MAKLIITFEDLEDNGIDMKVEFDPPLVKPFKCRNMTLAQKIGWSFAQAAMSDLQSQSEDED